jgi:hypothetical protein
MRPAPGRLLEIAACKQKAACHHVNQKTETGKGAGSEGRETAFRRGSLLR